jgi:O-antigen/teichoic acid export membrane protein
VPTVAHRRQAVWTITGQVLSSVANFSLTIAVARAVDAEVGGAFTYAFLVFSLGLGLMHTISTDPLVIRFSAGSDGRPAAVRAAAGSSLLLGVLAGLVCLVAGLVARGELGSALALLGLVLPGQFLQDSFRRAAFATGDARRAAANDGLRLLVQTAGIAACAWTGTTDLTWYMLTWALGAWAGALLGMRQFGLPRGRRGSVVWIRANAPLSVRLGSEFAVNMGGFTLTTSLLAAILGLAATGGLRFAQTLLGPIQVLFGAVVAFVVPLLARRLATSGPRSLSRPTQVVTLGCAAICAAVVGVLLLLPDAAGRELLGDSWPTARAVLLPVGVTQCAQAVLLCVGLPLKAMGRADQLLWVTLVQAPLSMVLALTGALTTGIEGAAWGLATGHGVGCLVMVLVARRVIRVGDVSPMIRHPRKSLTQSPTTVTVGDA